MKKIMPFIIVLVIFFGCKKELIKEPKHLIDKEKMVRIMCDLVLLEGMRVQNPTLIDSLKISTNEYIYKKYKIDSIQFAQSNIYYASDYKEYEKIYNNVKERIEKNKVDVNTAIKAKAKKEIDSIKKSKQVKALTSKVSQKSK